MHALEEGPRQRRRIECPKGAQLLKAASMTSALESSLPYLLKRQKRQLSLPLHSFYAVVSAKGNGFTVSAPTDGTCFSEALIPWYDSDFLFDPIMPHIRS